LEEFTNAYRGRFDDGITDTEIKQMFNVIDANSDGQVAFSEFVAAVLPQGQ